MASMKSPASVLELDQVMREGFSLVPHLQRDTLVIRFSGNGDMDAVQVLGAFLKDVQREALRFAVREVRFDFGELYFLNSSCFKAFVSWIVPVSKMSPLPYRIVFASNPQLHWQNRSLDSLQKLAPKVVTVEKPGPA
jgi:hypothetical protein